MTFIKQIKDVGQERPVRITALTDEEERTYYVRHTVYAAIGAPCASAVLDDDTVKVIIEEDAYIRATKSALSLLSYADNSSYTLVCKLTHKGIPRSLAERVAADMVRRGYIDEPQQIRRLALSYYKRNLSERLICHKIAGKGYRRADVEREISALTACGTFDFSEVKRNIMASIPPDAADAEIGKILRKHGF